MESDSIKRKGFSKEELDKRKKNRKSLFDTIEVADGSETDDIGVTEQGGTTPPKASSLEKQNLQNKDKETNNENKEPTAAQKNRLRSASSSSSSDEVFSDNERIFFRNQQTGQLFYRMKKEFDQSQCPQVELLDNGYVKVEITRYATMLEEIDVLKSKIAGMSW